MARKNKVFSGFRLHIGLVGRRNTGKSSLLNALTRQDVSIVSEVAGTTTDPVKKPMELLPIGPVVFIDTAGIDDEGKLGEKRVFKTQRSLDRMDVAILVTERGKWSKYEDDLLHRFEEQNVRVIAVHNKCDLGSIESKTVKMLLARNVPSVTASVETGTGIDDVRSALLNIIPEDFLASPVIASDLVGPSDVALLVIPIDKEAPKGRIILPQVQTIRDLLDGDALCMVTKESQLTTALSSLTQPPKLVVTDSQAFDEVSRKIPSTVPMTGFSVLFSRLKGDLTSQVEGAVAVDSLKPGDKILVAKACTHHPIGEDIGRVKIPIWLTKYVGGELIFETVQGRDFPEDLSEYKLVIHCGGCMFNRRTMLSRIMMCQRQEVPITNYGLVIAYSLGILDRALSPFPAALDVLRAAKQNRKSA